MAKYTEWLTEGGLIEIGGWARDGLIDKQIAQNIGISGRAFTDWEKKFSFISSAFKRGREAVGRQMENTLFKSAAGYRYIEVAEELAEKGTKITKKVTKRVTPNPVAAIFWLKDRKPDEWGDQKETQIPGEVSVSSPFANLPEEELRRLAEDDG